jgi:hypothetical protein
MRDLIGSIIFFLAITLISTLIWLDGKGRIKFSDKGFVFSIVVFVMIGAILF